MHANWPEEAVSVESSDDIEKDQESQAERIPEAGIPQTPSIFTSFSDCLRSFRQLFLALSKKSSRVVILQQVKVPDVLDEYGRLKIWGDQTKATLPEKSRGSLDDTLRNESNLKVIVLNILRRLQTQLGQAIPIAERTYRESLTSDQDSISSVSADSDTSSGDEGSPRKVRVSKISVLVSHIFEQVRSLYHLSVLLRRPGVGDRYIHSIPKGQGNISRIGMSQYDYAHVQQKVRQWRGESKSSFGACNEQESVTTLADIQRREIVKNDLLDKTDTLCHRLSRANTRRREQLKYWIRNPDIREVAVSDESIRLKKLVTMGPTRVEAVEESGNQAPVIKEPKAATIGFEKMERSTTSKQSFSAVTRSTVDDSKTQSNRPRTTYAQSVVGTKRSNRVPDLPKYLKPKPASACAICRDGLNSTSDRLCCHGNQNPNFECPYCHLNLRRATMEDRQNWK